MVFFQYVLLIIYMNIIIMEDEKDERNDGVLIVEYHYQII